MKYIRTVLLIAVTLFIVYTKYVTYTPPAPGASPAAPASTVVAPSPATGTTPVSTTLITTPPPAPADDGIPAKAKTTLETVLRTGEPPDGYVGGTVWQNREGRLPAGGNYREFDVDPHHGQRNAERIIVEWDTKKAWYTGDHYQTFTPIP